LGKWFSDLATLWREKTDAEGNVYFVNKITRVSQWERLSTAFGSGRGRWRRKNRVNFLAFSSPALLVLVLLSSASFFCVVRCIVCCGGIIHVFWCVSESRRSRCVAFHFSVFSVVLLARVVFDGRSALC
jgi:hypothetical protein